MNNLTINKENIQEKIYTIRGVAVMLDEDLARLYQVETKQLNKAVNRNLKRFPEHFRFQLTKEEYEIFLRFQFGTLKENLNEDMRGRHRKSYWSEFKRFGQENLWIFKNRCKTITSSQY